eukprot:2175767-Pleurochrysis_carterae.AAC.2
MVEATTGATTRDWQRKKGKYAASEKVRYPQERKQVKKPKSSAQGRESASKREGARATKNEAMI